MAGIVPHSLRRAKNLGDLLLDDLCWPLGKPMTGKYVRDLRSCDHIVTFPYSRNLLRRRPKIACHISLALPEPRAIHGIYYLLLPLIRHKYFRVFTRYKHLDTPTNNIAMVPLARSAIPPDISGLVTEQRKPLSLIASNKQKTKGHKLRHKIIQQLKSVNLDVDILGRGYQPYDKDHEGLLPYRYSVVIENAQENNYFTEKVIDCLLCRTVPIYWGCSDIDAYFDTSNWFIFDNVEEGMDAIGQALATKPDNSAIEKNFQQALNYLDPDGLCANYVLNVVEKKVTTKS